LFVCLFGLGLSLPFYPYPYTPSPTRPRLRQLCCFQQAATTITYVAYCCSTTSPIQNMCGISSLAFTTVALRDFIYFTGCRHLFRFISTFPCFRNPSVKPRTTAHYFLKKTSQRTSPRRACYNLPQCTTTRPAACSGLFQTGGMFAVVRFDFEVRGQLITLSPGPNSRVTNANVYENRWRYS